MTKPDYEILKRERFETPMLRWQDEEAIRRNREEREDFILGPTRLAEAVAEAVDFAREKFENPA